MEASNVEHLGSLDNGPVFWLLQVGRLEVVGGGKVSDQRPVDAVDQCRTLSRGNVVLHHVRGTQTNRLVSVNQLVCVDVLAYGTKVEHGLGWQHVLGASGSVLRSTTGNELHVLVPKDLVEDWHVLWLCQDGVVFL